MTNYVALYRGRTVSDATLVALSAEPRLVRRFFAELLEEHEMAEGLGAETQTATLELVRDEAREE